MAHTPQLVGLLLSSGSVFPFFSGSVSPPLLTPSAWPMILVPQPPGPAPSSERPPLELRHGHAAAQPASRVRIFPTSQAKGAAASLMALAETLQLLSDAMLELPFAPPSSKSGSDGWLHNVCVLVSHGCLFVHVSYCFLLSLFAIMDCLATASSSALVRSYC